MIDVIIGGKFGELLSYYVTGQKKDKVQKKSCQGIEQAQEARRREIKPFLL